MQFVDNRNINRALQRVEDDYEDVMQGTFNKIVKRLEDRDETSQMNANNTIQSEQNGQGQHDTPN